MIDYMIKIESAQAVTAQAMTDAKNLADKLPDGQLKLAALMLVSKLAQASVLLMIRRPVVPCRLDFISVNTTDDVFVTTEILSKTDIQPGQDSKIVSEQDMLARINLLSDEMDANEEENRGMQSEIDILYAAIDATRARKLENPTQAPS